MGAGRIAGNGGHRSWSMTREDDGHRTYRISFLVEVEEPGRDGPFTALYNTPGLPQPGDPWIHNNDADLWAFCKRGATVTEVQDNPGHPVKFFLVTFTFSTRGDSECADGDIQDPLLEPQKVSGGSVRYVQELVVDITGRPMLTSSHEQLRGPIVEFDWNRDQVRISQNVPLLEHTLCTSLRDHVNAYPLWGYPARCVKLSDFSWDKVYRGQCQVYYKRHFTFDISYKLNPITGLIESGFDRVALDEGSKCLEGKFNKTTGEYEVAIINGQPADPGNPLHFKRYQGRDGNVARCILNGAGLPASVVVAGSGMSVSVVDGNLGQAVSNIAYWLPLVSLEPFDWDDEATYERGEVVNYTDTVDPSGNGVYLAIARALPLQVPPSTPAKWRKLPNGLVDAGEYNAATTYDLGDYVSVPTGVGTITIRGYPAGDLLALGIPLVF